MFANLGPGHWLVLGVVMVLTFAGSKLPDAARYAGQVAGDLQVRVAGAAHGRQVAEKPLTPPTPVQAGRFTAPAGQASTQTNTDA